MLWFLIAVVIILSFWIIICSLFFILPLFFGAPYEGTEQKKINDIVKIANAKKNEKVVDLGSGDGRIVMAFAKRGIESHGFEINPLLVLISKIKIKLAKLDKKTFIHWKSFWKVNFADYDIIILFQYKTLMNKLKIKLKKEAKKSAKIISYYWKFPDWKISQKIRNIYRYKI